MTDQRQDADGPRLRASDADRHAAARAVQDAVARGQLAFDEGGERMAAAYASRYLDQLPPLTADLPAAPALPAAVPGWRALGTMTVVQLRHTLATASLRGPVRNRLALAAALLAVVLAAVLVLVLGAAVLHGLLDGGPGAAFHDAGAHAGHFDPPDRY